MLSCPVGQLPRSGSGPAMSVLIEGRGITKRFGELIALDGVDITVEAGRSVGVIGESGSGKTTLVKILLGILAPDAGSVRFAGQDVTVGGFGQRPWRRDMQVVLQDPYSSLAGHMTVNQIIAEPIRLLQRRKASDQEIKALLDEVGLHSQLADRYPHQLSGGQRQRVAIARALSVSPKVLIADEPVSALDVTVRAEILDMLGDLIANRDLTLVVVSHDLGVVQRLCPHTIVLNSGQIVEAGPTLELLTEPKHDVTRALLAAVPKLDES